MSSIFCARIVWVCACLTPTFPMSCEFIRVKAENNEDETHTPVARVHNTYLYAHDLEGITAGHASAEDSILSATMYVNKWVQEQLFIAEALKQIDINEAAIEKKVSSFRNSLIGYQFRKLYVQQHLVDSVSDKDVKTYYTDYQENFVLKQNIIKGTYIKIPRGTSRTSMLKSLMYATDEKSKDELKSYCIGFSVMYHLSDLNWIEFDKLIINSPLEKLQDKALFLRKHSYYETEDDDFLYLLKIDAYKIAGDTSPLEFVVEDIKNTIINKRKVYLARQQEDEIYKNAVENEDFELYTK